MEITIGKWRDPPAGHTFQPSAWHKGIWYNMESFLINTEDDMSDRVSLTMSVTVMDVNRINNIISKNDSWSWTKNCAAFAESVWDSVAPDSLMVMAGTPSTPATLSNYIKGYGDRSKTKRPVQLTSPIGYLDSNGNFVRVTVSKTATNQISFYENAVAGTLEVS